MRHLATVDNLPWLCIGDYNDLLSEFDKKGGDLHPQWLYRGFREAIMDCDLSDVPLSGYGFTWFRGRNAASRIEERLDRAMCNPLWHNKFPHACLLNLIAPVSDHNPILLKTEGYQLFPRHKKFRFENRWFQEENVKEVIRKCWLGFCDFDVLQRLSATAETLETWGNKADSKFRREKKMLEQRIERLQAGILAFDPIEYNELRTKLGKLLVQEEIIWKQRDKVFWLKDGDLNTRFFHQSATAHKRRNKIGKLQNANGIWVEGQEAICIIVGDYFSNLFAASEDDVNYGPFLNNVNHMLSNDQNEKLTRDFSIEEFDIAISQMHGDKSPGPDGFNPAFNKKMLGYVA